MKFKLSYQLVIRFSELVINHQYALRVFPRLASGVSIHQQDWSVAGKHDRGNLLDGFANQMLFGSFKPAHEVFEFNYQALLSREMVYQTDLPIEWFLPQSQLTQASHDLLLSWLVDLTPTASTFEQAMQIMQCVYARMSYVKGSTQVWHGVETVLQQAMGVCQDYAHVMIALLRLLNIPARYVAGVAQGEGESHAWVEAWIDGWWQGFDPTHNCMVSYQDAYIPIAVGRDASDCPLNMGQFVGLAQQVLTVQTQLTPA